MSQMEDKIKFKCLKNSKKRFANQWASAGAFYINDERVLKVTFWNISKFDNVSAENLDG